MRDSQWLLRGCVPLFCRVRAARRAADAGEFSPPCARRLAADCFACPDRARRETVLLGSFSRACRAAAALRGLRFFPALSDSCAALRLVLPLADDEGRAGMPARRAFDKPMATACLVFFAPCLPSRTWCTSSRTNSPAAVDGALPCARSCSAACLVASSVGSLGVIIPLRCWFSSRGSGPSGKARGQGERQPLDCGVQ
jgi:hypothetical protein